jgi:hypothetical protein
MCLCTSSATCTIKYLSLQLSPPLLLQLLLLFVSCSSPPLCLQRDATMSLCSIVASLPLLAAPVVMMPKWFRSSRFLMMIGLEFLPVISMPTMLRAISFADMMGVEFLILMPCAWPSVIVLCVMIGLALLVSLMPMTLLRYTRLWRKVPPASSNITPNRPA